MVNNECWKAKLRVSDVILSVAWTIIWVNAYVIVATLICYVMIWEEPEGLPEQNAEIPADKNG